MEVYINTKVYHYRNLFHLHFAYKDSSNLFL
nr:MAG TPA: hypothetical protein [Caudoviricetes sp.]